MAVMRKMQHAVCHSSQFTRYPVYLFGLFIAGNWKCHDGTFKCTNATNGDITCVNSTLLCDGSQHCSDSSDEETCGRFSV